MKKLILLFAFTLLVTTLSSCTADEIQTEETTQNEIHSKDGEIDPPKNPIKP